MFPATLDVLDLSSLTSTDGVHIDVINAYMKCMPKEVWVHLAEMSFSPTLKFMFISGPTPTTFCEKELPKILRDFNFNPELRLLSHTPCAMRGGNHSSERFMLLTTPLGAALSPHPLQSPAVVTSSLAPGRKHMTTRTNQFPVKIPLDSRRQEFLKIINRVSVEKDLVLPSFFLRSSFLPSSLPSDSSPQQ